MSTYTLSYFIKGAKDFPFDSQVVDVGNGWAKVVRIIEADDDADAVKQVDKASLPVGAFLHNLNLMKLKQSYSSKPKRIAEWKHNPLSRYATRKQ